MKQEKKEHELLTKALTSNVSIRYGKDKIEIVNKKNLKETIVIHIPPELLPKVQSLIRQPRLIIGDEWDEIRNYLSEVSLAIIKMQAQSSTLKERELFIAWFAQLIEKLEEKKE